MRRSFATLSWVAIAALIAATPSSIAQVWPGQPGGASAAAQPASTADEAAVLANKSWSVSTGNISIAANKVLDVVLANPPGNTCTAIIILRRFTNASTSQLAYQTYSTPGTLTGATSLNPGNRLIGNAPASGMALTYVVENAGLMTGTPGVQAPLLATGEENIEVVTALPPGKALGVEILGLTGGLANAVTVALIFAGYCTP